MPIFYGHPTTQSNKRRIEISPALKELGLELLRAAPSQVSTLVLPYTNSPLWASFVYVLSALVFSLSENTITTTNSEGYLIDTKHSHPLPIPLPAICLQVSNPSLVVNTWLLDRSFEEQEIRGQNYYILNHPSRKVLNELLSEDSPVQVKMTNYTPHRFANLSAVLILGEMINTLSYALQVLSVPMWSASVERKDIIDPTMSGGVSLEAALTDIGMSENTSSSTPRQDHALASLFNDPLILSSVPNKADGVDGSKFAEFSAWSSIRTILSSGNLGFGVIARFVTDLSDDDSFGVPNFFSKYLVRSLGNSSAEIKERLSDYRSAWGILKSTDAGHILSHLVKSMEIAIESQCAITAIFDQAYYEGSIIQGLGFSISTRNEVHVSVSTEELRDELESLETHFVSSTRIIKIIKKFGGLDEDVFGDGKISDMEHLRRTLLDCRLTEDHREDIRKLSKRLRFPAHKWSINMNTIMKMISIIRGGSEAIDDDTPLGPEGIFSTDMVEVAMSCFQTGSCPSFRHPSGVPVDLSSLKAPIPPSDIKRKGGRGPQQVNNGGWIFSVRRVEFSEAVADFRLLMREKEARSMSSSAARGLGYFVVSGGNFERLFQELRECSAIFGHVSDGSSATTRIEATGVPKRVASSTIPGGVADKKRRVML